MNIKPPEEVAKEISVVIDEFMKKRCNKATATDNSAESYFTREEFRVFVSSLIAYAISAERVKASEWEMSCNSIAIKYDQTMKILSAERNANIEKIKDLEKRLGCNHDNLETIMKQWEKIRTICKDCGKTTFPTFEAEQEAIDRIRKLEAEAKAVLGSLRKYGRHTASCEANPYKDNSDLKLCDCGFDRALNNEKGE